MPVKPVLMSDLRKTTPTSPLAAHRNRIGNGNYNRFDILEPRSRTFSVGKRRLNMDDGPECASPKMPRLDTNQIFAQLAGHDKIMEEARTALNCAKLSIATLKTDDGGIGSAVAKLGEAIGFLIKSNESLKSSIVDMCKVPTPSQAPRPATSDLSCAPGGLFSSVAAKPPAPKQVKTLSDEDQLKIKVKDKLREAERRMVIFDLDLGNAPTINKETISRKVTLALHSCATDNSSKDDPQEFDSATKGEMLDDVLSCSQLEFLGSGTRRFFNNREPGDKRNGKMCTVPIRLDFKNKETRNRAEATVRKVCKIKCSVPYPKKLRTLLNAVISDGKT